MTDDELLRSESAQAAWREHELSQLRYFRSLSLREKFAAVEGMADVVRLMQRVRAAGGFKSAAAEGGQTSGDAPLAVREPGARYGSNGRRHDVALEGCTPEPLMNYLKALGVLRLVSEQADTGARGYWVGDVFHLVSTLNEAAFVEYFLRKYKPTPIVVPWSGSDFFDANRHAADATFNKTPTGARVIDAFFANKEPRLAEYRSAITAAFEAMEKSGIRNKEQMGRPELKAAYLEALRGSGQERLVDWIDAAAVIGRDKPFFSSLLGSGGGSDGNTHFSDNFMQNLWEVLAEFNPQRDELRKAGAGNAGEAQAQRNLCLLRAALFGEPAGDLVLKRTSSLYDSGAVGGPNATQGMERESLTNPWNFIFGLEGALLFGGIVAKRAGAEGGGTSFPFQFQFSATEADLSVLKEQAGREIWLPLWERRASLKEIRLLIGEGRAEVGRRVAWRGTDMARAASGLGVDRGIKAFQRYAIVRGRVGGENYNTAVSLGRFDIRFRQAESLLLQVDPWLDGFRRACSIGQKNESPARLTSALRRIDGAVFDYCRYGGAGHFQSILVALGRAERELMRDGSWAARNRVRPLTGLSLEWIAAADEGSTEFELALALAGVRDGELRIGPLRANLEPVALWRKGDGEFAKWAEKDRAVVWNAADISTNMAAVLARRVMDAAREGCARLPIESRRAASLESISAFLAQDVDDARVEALLWGLMLIDSASGAGAVRNRDRPEVPSLPRAYALLKLLFLPRPLAAERRNDGGLRWRYVRHDERGVDIRPEPRVLPLLRAGRIGDACEIAARRLRASGFTPMAGTPMWDAASESASGTRLAAALLLPIDSRSVDRLIRLVIREDASPNSEPFDSEEEAA